MLLQIVHIILTVLWWFIIAQAVMSWLIAFNVINMQSNFVRSMVYGFDRLTDPLYRPIRRIMPDLGALDLSPLIVLVIIQILRGPVLGYFTYLAVSTM